MTGRLISRQLNSRFISMCNAYPKLERVVSSGLTVREEFIKAAMQGLLASDVNDSLQLGTMAEAAVMCADRVIAEMNKPISAPDAKQHSL